MDNSQTRPKDGQIVATSLYLAAKALERGGYYGLRAILVIYMVGEILQMETTQAMAIYGWFALLIAVTQIVGGVVGDLLLGNKWTAVIGGILQALGAFAFCIPSVSMIWVGIGLVSLGSGLYIPNVLSNFGKLYLPRSRYMDSGYTLFYTATNVGAFVGIMLIGFLGDNNFVFGFIASGVLLSLSGLLLALAPKEKESEPEAEADHQTVGNSIPNKIALIAIGLILSTLFWGFYEVGATFQHMSINRLASIWMDKLSIGFLSGLGTYSVMFFGVVGVIVWYITNVNRFVKISIGFVLGSVSFALLMFIPENSHIIHLVIFIVSIFLIGIAELMIAPTVNAIITVNSNPKYLAIIFSLVFLPIRLIYYVVSKITEATYDTPKLGIGIAAVLFLVLGITTFVGYIALKSKSGVEVG